MEWTKDGRRDKYNTSFSTYYKIQLINLWWLKFLVNLIKSIKFGFSFFFFKTILVKNMLLMDYVSIVIMLS